MNRLFVIAGLAILIIALVFHQPGHQEGRPAGQ